MIIAICIIIIGALVGMILDMVFDIESPQVYWGVGFLTGALALGFGVGGI